MTMTFAEIFKTPSAIECSVLQGGL